MFHFRWARQGAPQIQGQGLEKKTQNAGDAVQLRLTHARLMGQLAPCISNHATLTHGGMLVQLCEK